MAENCCYFHENTRAMRICKECGNYYCEDCNKLTNFSAHCLACYRPKIKKKYARLCRQNKVDLVSMLSFLLAAIILGVVAIIVETGIIVMIIAAAICFAVSVWKSVNYFTSLLEKRKTKATLDKVNIELDKILVELRKGD